MVSELEDRLWRSAPPIDVTMCTDAVTELVEEITTTQRRPVLGSPRRSVGVASADGHENGAPVREPCREIDGGVGEVDDDAGWAATARRMARGPASAVAPGGKEGTTDVISIGHPCWGPGGGRRFRWIGAGVRCSWSVVEPKPAIR